MSGPVSPRHPYPGGSRTVLFCGSRCLRHRRLLFHRSRDRQCRCGYANARSYANTRSRANPRGQAYAGSRTNSYIAACNPNLLQYSVPFPFSYSIQIDYAVNATGSVHSIRGTRRIRISHYPNPDRDRNVGRRASRNPSTTREKGYASGKLEPKTPGCSLSFLR